MKPSDLGLTQRQVTLLRRIIEVSSTVPENESIEFMVSVTHNTGTSLVFFGARGHGIGPVSQSDLNELKRRGCLIPTRFSGRGDEILQVSNEAFALFRTEEVVDFSPTRFDTGDPTLDDLLDSAVTKYLTHDIDERRNALEKLWDAWERSKTLETNNKKQSLAALLDKVASEPIFREILEQESRTLTDIGNKFRIRHHETGKIEMSDPSQVDYLFERMLSLLRLILRKSGRM